MKRITEKEEEIMNLYWQHGPMFVKELLEYYDEPRPHFNTISTFVRELESKGYLSHKAFGNTYQYIPIISREEYNSRKLKSVVENYFNKSYLNAVSTLVKDEDISVDELKQLIAEIEHQNKK
jgi:Predicted transcriptional regulator